MSYRWERRAAREEADRRRMPKSGRSVFVAMRASVERAVKQAARLGASAAGAATGPRRRDRAGRAGAG